MFDFDSLIGLEIEKAKALLNDAGFNNIEIVLNTDKRQKYECDTILVCAVRVADDSIRLICGEFLFQLKGENV
ncbi:MAG: hypothetical protein IJA23_05655 [Clostridia bacterium]|nr:hypothetical protein [Clostridia bacterium]